MIALRDVSIAAGAFRLDGVSFEVPGGAYAVLMGPTGAGKTTILETVAGLKRVLAGRIFLGGRDVTRLLPAERDIGYVPQDVVLFGELTVRENLAFALAARGDDRRARRARAGELAEALGLTAILDRRPAGLSGGERQRVALGRALAHRPSTLLIDEALSALDEATREGIRGVLRGLRGDGAPTVLHVTHSPDDAAALGDVVLELAGGRVAPRRTRAP